MITIFKTFFTYLKNKISFTTLSAITSKIFNLSNLNKAIIIFIIGLISRIFIINYYNINVFIEYFNNISILYYSLFSLFTVAVHEIVNYFSINIIPHFITDFFTHIINLIYPSFKILNSAFKNLISPYYILSKLKWDDFKPSSIRKYINFIFTKTVESKLTMGTDSNNAVTKNIPKVYDKPLIPNVLNMDRDFNLYDSDRNSSDISSIGERSGYSNTPNRGLYSNDTPFTTTDNTPVRPRVQVPVANNNYNNEPLLFRVDTIRENSDVGSVGLQTPNPNDNIPRAPLPSGFTTPSTMTPLFGNSRNSSMRSSYYNHGQTYENNSHNNVGEYPVPGQVAYFNPPKISLESNKAVIGLNASNENIWRDRFASSSVNWSEQEQNYNANARAAQQYIEIGEKEVVPSLINAIVPHEVEVKRGIFGKIKLTFNLIDSKLESKISNMDSIALKYHDKSKRKFFWTIWEKKSGNYESYEDFKQSWDPKTNIWAEIKGRTNNDVRTDVEGILGVGRNRNQLHSAPTRGIQQRNVDVSTGVNNLIRERQPFNFTQLNAEENLNTVENNEAPRRRHRSRSHSHKHSTHGHSRRHHKK